MFFRNITLEMLLEKEVRGCFNFFWKEANNNPLSPGYGLIRDRAPGKKGFASIASVGFGLAALVIGAERSYKPYNQIRERVLGTLNTLLNNVEQVNGFFYHFLDMNTAKRFSKCEVSIIDTAIAVCGVLTAGEYFDGEIKEKAQEIYACVNWTWYTDIERQLFYMGYTPEKGFFGEWNEYAEQFMMYFLSSASPTYPADSEMFYTFKRTEGYYKDIGPIIHSTPGSLFVYQYSHAFFDLRGKMDRYRTDWWQNSIYATLANCQYCMDHSEKFKTFGKDSWGITACDGPGGYSGAYGAPPRRIAMISAQDIHDGNDGTVAPCGAAGSIVLTPELSSRTLLSMYEKHPQLWGKYGFKDSYNLSMNRPWFATDYIGIDKGISMLMIENYRSGLIWDVFMKNRYIREGMEKCNVYDKTEALV
jgi:hypothetical protein